MVSFPERVFNGAPAPGLPNGLYVGLSALSSKLTLCLRVSRDPLGVTLSKNGEQGTQFQDT